MKFTLSILLHAGLGLILTLFVPYFWSTVIIAFVIGFAFKIDGWKSFIAGFLGMLGLWAGYALFLDVANEAILSEKVAQLFQLSNANLLIVITGLIGGLLGGFGALTGRYLREIFMPQKKRYGTRRRKSRYNLPIVEE